MPNDAAPVPQTAPRPDDIAELVRQGHAARHGGDRAAALACFGKILAERPDHEGVLLEAALDLRELGRLDEAEAHYRRVLERAPEQVPALLGLGHCARRRGDREGALARFEAVAAAHPAQVSPRIDAGDLLRESGRWDEAEAHYRAALERAPDHLSALLGLGHCARRRGDREGALARFEAAAAAHPAQVSPHVDAGDLLRDGGRLDEAEAHYRAALERAPAQYSATVGLALILRRRRERAAARALLERATESDPRRMAGWLELAAELRDAGDFEAARAAAEAAMRHHPASAQPWTSIGHTERQAARRDEALAAFKRAAETEPAQTQPYVEMAVEARALGRPHEAQALLERALELSEDDPRARQQLGEQARLAGDPAAALEHFRRAIAADPAAIGAWCGASQALQDLGRGQEALAALEEAERGCGARAEFLTKRAELLRLAGDWHRAREVVGAAGPDASRNFHLQMERLRLARFAGAREEIEAALAAASGGSTQEEGRLEHVRGQIAEDEWRIAEAVGHYERARALLPRDGGVHHDLARTRLLLLDTDAARDHLRALHEINAASLILQGRSLNISQSHLGEILNETELDSRLLARLVALRGLPPEARAERLLTLAREFPDHTPAAMQFIIAARQAGWLERSRTGAAREPTIPRSIAQFWDAPDPPEDLELLMRSWQDANPGYAYRRFCDADAQAFLRETCAPPVLAAYRRAREPAQKADIFRLAWLFAEGGWYADADDRCLAPLERLAPANASLVVYQEEYGTIGNNVVGAAPGEPVIGAALAQAVAAVNRGDADIVWFSTGPGLMTRALVRHMARSPLRLEAWLRRRVVLERRELFRCVAVHCSGGYKQTARHWLRSSFAKQRSAAA